jgi:hypothetical protein
MGLLETFNILKHAKRRSIWSSGESVVSGGQWDAEEWCAYRQFVVIVTGSLSASAQAHMNAEKQQEEIQSNVQQ